MSVSYTTCYNGKNPFTVTIDDVQAVQGKARVTVKDNETGTVTVYDNVRRVFVGKSPLNELTEFSGGAGPQFDGNTMLFETEVPQRYVYVCNVKKTFDTVNPIDYYTSPLGNNDVPYPVAIDTANRVYLLGGDVVLTRVDVPASHAERDQLDFYTDFYDQSVISGVDMGWCGMVQPTMYVAYYIDNKRYTWRWSQGNRVKGSIGLALVINGVEGERRPVSAAVLKKIEAEFAAIKGFEVLTRG